MPPFVSRPQALRVYQSRKARQFITAGGKNEQVSDSSGPDGHSVFTGHFLRAIKKGTADSNGDGFITFFELASLLESTASTSYQTPFFGRFPGDEGGSFLFAIKPGSPLPPPALRRPSSISPRSSATETDLEKSQPPRSLRIRAGTPSSELELGISVSAIFSSLGDVPYVTIMVQSPDGQSSRQACYDGGTKLAFSLDGRLFRGLLTSIDWESEEVTLSLTELVRNPSPQETKVKIPGQRIKYLQILLDSFEVLDSAIRVSLRARNTSGDRGLALAWFAEHSGGIADFWKFFPRVNAIATDDQGHRYEYSSSDGLGFATTREDWLIIKAGEESSIVVDLRRGNQPTGKVFSFSAPIRLAWGESDHEEAQTGMFNVRLTDIHPTRVK